MKVKMFFAAMAMTVAVSAQDVQMKSVGNVEMVVSYALDQLCEYPNQWRDFDWRNEGTLILETSGGGLSARTMVDVLTPGSAPVGRSLRNNSHALTLNNLSKLLDTRSYVARTTADLTEYYTQYSLRPRAFLLTAAFHV